jgi:hypothetical protein
MGAYVSPATRKYGGRTARPQSLWAKVPYFRQQVRRRVPAHHNRSHKALHQPVLQPKHSLSGVESP